MGKMIKPSEYSVLLREHRDLVAEHERLEANPHDLEAHHAHRLRLIDHNKRLHDFMATHFLKPRPAAEADEKTVDSAAPVPPRRVASPKPKKSRRSGRR